MSLAGGALKHLVATVAPGRVLLRGSGRSAQVALSFDDGPHPENTPRILDALDAAGAKATFFVQGDHAARHPPLVRRLHQRGHLVANHAATHRSPAELGTQAYVREVTDTQSLLDDIVGHALPRRFRPPYGATSVRTFARLARAGFRYVFWSRDSRDSWLRDAASLHAAFEHEPARAGDIVLFHDDYNHTAEALPGVLEALRRAGLAAVTVEDLR